MKRNKRWIGLLASTMAVAAFALIFAVALPQTASAHGGPDGFSGRANFGAPVQDNYLADALGISVEELQAARAQAADAAIDQAVDEGLITEAQAEMIRDRGMRFFGKIGRFGRIGRIGSSTIDFQSLLADALGISVDDLQAAHDQARDAALAQAVADGRITQEQVDQMRATQALRDYLVEQGLPEQLRSTYEEAVQGAVTAGVITQEQADQILSQQRGFGMHGFSPRSFRGQGMRGFGGKFFSPPASNSTIPSRFSF